MEIVQDHTILVLDARADYGPRVIRGDQNPRPFAHPSTEGRVGLQLPDGIECPPAVNEPVVFDVESPDMAVYKSLSERMQKRIAASPEWQGGQGGKTDADVAGRDDIPF